jgi:hypothetical protein
VGPPRQQAECPPRYCSSRSRSAPPPRPKMRSASSIGPLCPSLLCQRDLSGVGLPCRSRSKATATGAFYSRLRSTAPMPIIPTVRRRSGNANCSTNRMISVLTDAELDERLTPKPSLSRVSSRWKSRVNSQRKSTCGLSLPVEWGGLSVQLAAIWGMSVEIDCNLEAGDGVVSSSPEHCPLGRLLRFRSRCRHTLTPPRRAARVRPVCIDGGIAGVSADAETSRS